jgi:hypothetical protein
VITGKELDLPFEDLEIDSAVATIFEELLRYMLAITPNHRPTIKHLCQQLQSCAELAPVLSRDASSNQGRLIVAIDFGIALCDI